MRRAVAAGLVGLAAVAAPASGAAAAAPRVDVMVVGREKVLRAPTTVAARAASVRVGRRRCAVGAGTPLAVLAALRAPSFRVRDFGSCSTRPRDAESLFVDRIGTDVNRGVDGWVYKVGRRTPGIGAGALAARVRTGARVLWMWCRQGPRGCRRSLEVTAAPRRAAPGAPVTFAVRGYDDRARGVPVGGALVSFAGMAARTGPDGRVTVAAPGVPGRHRASAAARSMVPSFPVEVTVA